MSLLRLLPRVIPLAATLLATTALADPLSPTVPVNSNAAVDSGADTRPAIAMDATGQVVVVWTSTDTLGGTIGTDADILVSRSANSGVTWSPVAAISPWMNADAAEDRAVTVATNRRGVYIAAWQTQNRWGSDWDVMFARSTNAGQSWAVPPGLLNTNGAADAADDISPRIATDGNNRWIAVWASGSGGDHDIMYAISIDDGITWSAPALVDPASALDVDDDLDPVVTADENGRWMIAWASNDARNGMGIADFDIVQVRSANDGVSWSAPALLNGNGNTDAGDDRAVDVAADGNGRWLAVWHEHGSFPWGPDGDILQARSANDGANWSMPREIYGFAVIELGDERDPHIVTDRQGSWNVVWWREDSLPGGVGQDVDILQARTTDNGVSWIGPELINNDAFTDVGNDYCPAIATSRTGNWRVVWHSDDSLSGTIGTDLDVVTSGAVCGDGFVQLAEQCDDGNLVGGDCCTPTCQLAPPGVICRAAVGYCDAHEMCDGVSGLCPADAVAPVGETCRISVGPCDRTEVCDGVTADCPVDIFLDTNVQCRAAASACDAPEACTGTGPACPADLVQPAGAECRAAAGACDVAETCDGVGGECPTDLLAVSGTECRAAAGACDVADTCDGAAATCPADARQPVGTLCRGINGVCDAAEVCTGGVDCPNDRPVADGTGCADGVVCDGTEICIAGACVAGQALTCDDGDACTAESCNEPGGCGINPVPGCCNTNADCGDGDACTTDVCSGPGGTCQRALVPGCCNADADCNDLDACTVDVCSGPGGTCGSSEITGCCTQDADCAAVACGTVACNVGTQRCETTPVPGCCTSDADCNDGNACTTNTCNTQTGACGVAPVANCCLANADCDDGDVCTADSCGAGNTCGSAPVAGCCDSDADCNDGNACTTDACNTTTNRCEAAPVADCCTVDADCAAGPVCTTVSCQQGACVQAATPNCCMLDSDCDDGDGCTFDRCTAGTCEHPASCDPDAGVSDGAVSDGAVSDGAASDGAESDGAESDGSVPESDAAVDGSAPEADATVSDPDGSVPESDAGQVESDGALVWADATVPGPDAGSDAAVAPVDGSAVDGGVGDGAAMGSDGAVVDPSVDAGQPTGDEWELDDDGCECTAVSVRSEPRAPWGILALLGVAVALRHRRRRTA